ncbi:MAG: MAPEG family protein [Alphaproteobacteria bacterium]|nr:MAPEG family protein [Alphaproteobacteria bacterium]
MTLHITLYFVALFAIIQVIITNLVGAARIRNEVHFYDEGDIALRRNVRAHGNFTETVPMTLLVMAGAEISGTAGTILWAGGICLLIGRSLHYWIIRRHGWGNLRAISMILTFIPMGGFAIAIFWQLARGGIAGV